MFLRILKITTLLAATTLVAGAAERTSAHLAFSDPARPGTLQATFSNGSVKIRGGDVDTVTVRSSARADGQATPRPDGLRVIGTSSSFAFQEKDNVITLDYGRAGWSDPAEFDIVVPRATTLQLRLTFGGEVSIEGIEGDVEIKNLNGSIRLRELGGGAIVESMNGEIDATLARLPEGKPLSFTSMNGEIRLRVPADAKANVRFRTQNGAILTDFAEDVLVTRTEASPAGPNYAPQAAAIARAATAAAREAMAVAAEIAAEVQAAVQEELGEQAGENETPRAPRAPRPPRAPRAPGAPTIPALAGGKVVSGTLNGGGTDIQIATMNGDIVVRRLE